jgi:hypothetical protein
VIDERVQTRLASGIRHRDAAKLAEEIEHADVDAARTARAAIGDQSSNSSVAGDRIVAWVSPGDRIAYDRSEIAVCAVRGLGILTRVYRIANGDGRCGC